MNDLIVDRTPPRLPTLFVAHGAPPLLDDAGWVRELASWSGTLPRPRSILMLSAHWEERPATIGATRTVPLIYDFFGFPAKYYEQTYAAPGAPELAERITTMLNGNMRSPPIRREGWITERTCRSSRCIRRRTSRCSRCRFRARTLASSSRSAGRCGRCARRAC